MLAAGYAPKRLARFLNVKAWRVREIQAIHEAGQRELEKDQVWIDHAKAQLTKGFLSNAADALVQANESLPSASALQAATIAGISVDKALALSQKGPAVNVSQHVHLHVAKAIDEIDAQLAKLVDVTSDK